MRQYSILHAVFLCFILLAVALPIPAEAQESPLSTWNNQWSSRQLLTLPIDTSLDGAVYQPIDLQIVFDAPCWAHNETIHSVRVCCWHNDQWHEIESQIYDLVFKEEDVLSSCNLVFLIPEFATGSERYYVYYDDQKKSAPAYTNHVDVKDNAYSYSPIPELKAEVNYYGIYEDSSCLYGVGQEGEFLRRALCQVVVKQLPGSTDFDIFNVDQIASFAMSLQVGPNEEDEISTEQSLVSKKIFIDGNLMVQFGVISESRSGEIRTTALYRYYYNPSDSKRLCTRVRHEVTQPIQVVGEKNLDGRYGALISFKSRNSARELLNFGDIQPWIYFHGEQGDAEQYPMNINPESKDQNWVLSFVDDADLGEEAWIAYGDEQGNMQSLLFSSNKGLLLSGTDERDGIQLKVAEREYLDFLGTEIDYATINFGRNSYESGGCHDLDIPDDFIIEFDAEFFSTPHGDVDHVRQEAAFHQQLSRQRHVTVDPDFETQQKTFDLTVITHLGGTRFSYPVLTNITRFSFPVMEIELWKNTSLYEVQTANRTFFFKSVTTFHDVPRDTYVIRAYYTLSNGTRFYNGATIISLNEETQMHLFCRWQRSITCSVNDQHGHSVPGVLASVHNADNYVLYQNISNALGDIRVIFPWEPLHSPRLTLTYHGFTIYDEEISQWPRNQHLDVALSLYEFTVKVQDTLGFPPAVDVYPSMSSQDTFNTSAMIATPIGPGEYYFSEIPEGTYYLSISYSGHTDEQQISIPEDGDLIDLLFSATFDVSIEVYDRKGYPLPSDEITYSIYRQGTQIADNVAIEEIQTYPPASYNVQIYDEYTIIGQTTLDITSDTFVDVITNVQSSLPHIIQSIALFGIAVLLFLGVLRVINRNMVLFGLVFFLLVISLLHPWWMLQGENITQNIDKTTEMFLEPPVIIESLTDDGVLTLELANLPDIFTDILESLLLVIYATMGLAIAGIIISYLQRHRYALVVSVILILLCIIVLGVYGVATSVISEASVGSLSGDGSLQFLVDEQGILFDTQWGFALGYYLVAAAIILLLILLITQSYQMLHTHRQNSKP